MSSVPDIYVEATVDPKKKGRKSSGQLQLIMDFDAQVSLIVLNVQMICEKESHEIARDMLQSIRSLCFKVKKTKRRDLDLTEKENPSPAEARRFLKSMLNSKLRQQYEIISNVLRASPVETLILESEKGHSILSIILGGLAQSISQSFLSEHKPECLSVLLSLFTVCLLKLNAKPVHVFSSSQVGVAFKDLVIIGACLNGLTSNYHPLAPYRDLILNAIQYCAKSIHLDKPLFGCSALVAFAADEGALDEVVVPEI